MFLGCKRGIRNKNMVTDEMITQLLEEYQRRFYGKYRGTVTDNDDPLHRGRVKANVPAVLGDVESGWCTACVPYAGSDKGLFALPEVGDGVWVEFEAGDPSHPIWTGSWWGDEEIPNDPSGSQGTFQTKILKSASGLIVDLDDSAGEIKISDSSGSNLLDIQVNAGQITIQANTSVTLEAPQINLGQSAAHPLVFGDSLLQYLTQTVITLQTHIHPTGVGPSGPPPVPITPPDPSLLSTNVMTK